MAFYHYTGLTALDGILNSNSDDAANICLWATRYDCFEDQDEYRLGINHAKKYLSILEEKRGMQKDRCIAEMFDVKEIESATGLPLPYVISVTARNDNDYMWRNYADNYNGVVLELDLSYLRGGYDYAILCKLEQCIYEDTYSDDELVDKIFQAYSDGGYAFLNTNKELFMGMLKDYPQLFVRFIAMYILAFFAPRIKRNKFKGEEESRIILSTQVPEYSKFIMDNIDVLNQISAAINSDLDFKNTANTIKNEKCRYRNGKKIYYRELYLPEESLKRIYVTNENTKQKVQKLLLQKHFTNVEVEIIDNNLS